MRLGRAHNATTLFPELPQLETIATYCDDGPSKSSIACLLVAPCRLTPDVPINDIKAGLPESWDAFVDSVRINGRERLYFAVIHRSDIPRSDIQGRFKL